MKRLLGKSALITGAGRGLGRAIALAFAAEGARLVLSYKDSAAAALQVVHEAHGSGVEALAIRADLAVAEEIEHLVSQSVDAFGEINVLVNNAGLFSTRSLLETSDELWERLLAVNLTAPFRCARALAPAMLSAGGGAIINLASGGGQHPRPGYDTSPAYAASKAGLIMLSKKLAQELAPTIRVNCISPGIIDSKPTSMPAKVRARLAALTPLGRVGDPRNVADAAVFLASDEAAFITGQVLNVDGGILM